MAKAESGLRNYTNLLWTMTEKELKVRYKKTLLGFLWVILNPLLEMAIIGFVFSYFINIPNYYLFLLIGLVPWTFFSQSVNNAIISIVSERRLLHKAKFPIEVIPLSVVIANLLNLVISFLLLLVFLLIFEKVIFVKLIFLIPAIFLLVVFTSGLCLLVSSLYVKFRDVGYIVRTVLILAFYVTPIVYDLSLIPSEIRGLFMFNPLSSIIELFRLSILNQGHIYTEILTINISISLAVAFLGILVFRKNKDSFVDWT